MRFSVVLAFCAMCSLIIGSGLPRCIRAADEATAKKYEQMVDKAITFLATKGQADDGSFNAAAGPAVTAAGHCGHSSPRSLA